MLAAVTLAILAFAASVYAKPHEIVSSQIIIDPATAEETGAELKDAFKQELPGLEEEKIYEMSDGHGGAPAQPHPSGSKGDASVVASVVPKNETVSDFEASVTALVLGLSAGGLGATPMGDSVTKMKELIEKDMMPKVKSAHYRNQLDLNKLHAEILQCGKTKDTSLLLAKKSEVLYQKTSPVHKACRGQEASLYTENVKCWAELKNKKRVKDLKCKIYSDNSRQLSDQQNNKNVVTKGGSEDAVTYVKRITATICGKPGGKGKGGHGFKGFEDVLLTAKEGCEVATRAWFDQDTECKKKDKEWHDKRAKCNGLQDVMDNAACKYAIDKKDACETYAECHKDKKAAFHTMEKQVRQEEIDRKAEWKGLQRMKCIIDAFSDGKVESSEITRCKHAVHSVNHLDIKYPTVPALQVCAVPAMYPYTAAYKKAEFTPLPALAKGKLDANECTGVAAISTQPAPGSPSTCKCTRVTMNGPFAAGAMVKCENCLGVRRTSDRLSCPSGTKLFSPQSRTDWDTFLNSAQPLRAPNWIVDVTRPQNGCGGCTRHEMNSGNAQQKTWVTKDGSPWWLRSTRYNEPNGDYHANCYLDLWHNPPNSNSVTFNDGSCSYHSKSYYCQSNALSLTPKSGSPTACICKKMEIAQGSYSGGLLVKCENCLRVRKANEKNSCPYGTKLFAPQSRDDWKAFIASAKPLRAPNWIIDITRPSNGCGGCTRNPMNSGVGAQATWKTADGSPWWLRSTRYNEPNGDYHANCYLDLWQTPPNENSVTWNDGNCNYHANSYYCQLARVAAKTTKTTSRPPWKVCCTAKTATCESCKKNIPVEQYCMQYPTTTGCYLAGLSTTPRKGSPSTCQCGMITLKGMYSAGALLKCTDCLDVSKSTQQNSCPDGTKLFSPSNQADWKTVFASAPDAKKTVAAPNWIVDVTRPQNSCGGCTRHSMNSGNAQQASWRTSDGSPWWFRDNLYSEPNGDYDANCYLDLWHTPTPDKIIWNDKKCTYHSKSYYCQPKTRR